VVDVPWSIGAGVVSLYALLALAITSWARRPLRLPYEPWRLLHGILAVGAVVLGAWHALAADRLLGRPVERVAWVAWTAAWTLLIVRVRLLKPLTLLRRPWVVRQVREERGGAVTLALEPDGHEGMRFRAGQFAWVTLFGSPLLAREHPFSFSGSAGAAPRLEVTVMAAGDFTRRLQGVKPGARAYVDGPFGTMSIDTFPDADGFVFVAGGIGAAPCLSMLRTLADRGDRRRHVLFYATPDWESTAFREILESLQARLDLEVIHVLERPHPGWTGEAGFVTPALLARHLPRAGRYGHFVCGPPRMMDAVEKALVELGVPLGDLHSERFDLV